MRLRSFIATKKRRALLGAGAIAAVAFGVLLVSQVAYVERAHQTFQNYYAFRGCQELLTKTANDATCRLSTGQVIKIVRYQNKWYLDGDLPVCWFGSSLCL